MPESDWYAREEPGSLRSQFGSNPKHVDEMLLQSIARSENLRSIPPFNSGVCLMNHGIWRGLIGLGDIYLGWLGVYYAGGNWADTTTSCTIREFGRMSWTE